MKKAALVLIIAVTLLTAGVLLYLGLRQKSSPHTLPQAAELVRVKNYDAAKKALADIVKTDPGNEDAFKLLAKIAENTNDYFGAAYFLDRLSALNPLDRSYVKAMFENMMIARTDGILASRYIQYADSPEMTDRIRYNAAVAFRSLGFSNKAAEIRKIFEAEKSPYARLLDADTAVARSNAAVAESLYRQIIKENPEIVDFAEFGLARCALLRGDKTAALEALNKIKGDFPELKGEILSTRAAISMLEKKPREALDYMKRACAVMRADPRLALACAELAFSQNDARTIDEFRKQTNTANKESLFLSYYLEALELAVKKDYAGARAKLLMSGEYAKRPVAAILAFTIAADLNLPDDAVDAFGRLPKNLPPKVKSTVAAKLDELLLKNKDNLTDAEKISAAVLLVSPRSELALRTMLTALLRDGKFADAISYSRELLKISPDDPQGLQSLAISLANTGGFEEGWKLSQKMANSPDADVFWLVYAALFAAERNDGENTARYAVASISKYSPPVQLVFMLGSRTIAESPKADAEKFIALLGSKSENAYKCVAKILGAQLAAKNKDFDAAERLCAQASEIIPQFELPYVMLAAIRLDRNEVANAKEAMETALAKNPNSPTLKLKYAALLSETGNADDAEKARDIANALISSNSASGATYAVLSQSLAGLGQKEPALEAARRAETLAPANPEVLIQLGRRLSESELWDKSFATLLRAARISKDARIRPALEKSLEKAAALAPSAQYALSLAESALRVIPNSETAKKISEDAKSKIRK